MPLRLILLGDTNCLSFINHPVEIGYDFMPWAARLAQNLNVRLQYMLTFSDIQEICKVIVKVMDKILIKISHTSNFFSNPLHQDIAIHQGFTSLLSIITTSFNFNVPPTNKKTYKLRKTLLHVDIANPLQQFSLHHHYEFLLISTSLIGPKRWKSEMLNR